MGTRRNTTWRSDQEAVSEVVGSALLVALTVVVVSAFGLVATQAFSPVKRVNADLSPLLDPGGCCWFTGDEQLRLTHLGGSSLERDATTIKVARAGTTTVYKGASLGSVFDGGFNIGERWSHTSLMDVCDGIQVQVILEHGSGGTQLLLQETLVANEGAC